MQSKKEGLPDRYISVLGERCENPGQLPPWCGGWRMYSEPLEPPPSLESFRVNAPEKPLPEPSVRIKHVPMLPEKTGIGEPYTQYLKEIKELEEKIRQSVARQVAEARQKAEAEAAAELERVLKLIEQKKAEIAAEEARVAEAEKAAKRRQELAASTAAASTRAAEAVAAAVSTTEADGQASESAKQLAGSTLVPMDVSAMSTLDASMQEFALSIEDASSWKHDDESRRVRRSLHQLVTQVSAVSNVQSHMDRKMSEFLIVYNQIRDNDKARVYLYMKIGEILKKKLSQEKSLSVSPLFAWPFAHILALLWAQDLEFSTYFGSFFRRECVLSELTLLPVDTTPEALDIYVGLLRVRVIISVWLNDRNSLWTLWSRCINRRELKPVAPFVFVVVLEEAAFMLHSVPGFVQSVQVLKVQLLQDKQETKALNPSLQASFDLTLTRVQGFLDDLEAGHVPQAPPGFKPPVDSANLDLAQ